VDTSCSTAAAAAAAADDDDDTVASMATAEAGTVIAADAEPVDDCASLPGEPRRDTTGECLSSSPRCDVGVPAALLLPLWGNR